MDNAIILWMIKRVGETIGKERFKMDLQIISDLLYQA